MTWAAALVRLAALWQFLIYAAIALKTIHRFDGPGDLDYELKSFESEFNEVLQKPITIETFTEMWEGHLSRDIQHFNKSLPAGQVVIGQFSVARALAFRNGTRNTWMNQRGICLLLSGPAPDCSVYVAFVHGTNSSAPALEETPDMLQLDIKENMNSGSTFEYFHYYICVFDIADAVRRRQNPQAADVASTAPKAAPKGSDVAFDTPKEPQKGSDVADVASTTSKATSSTISSSSSPLWFPPQAKEEYKHHGPEDLNIMD